MFGLLLATRKRIRFLYHGLFCLPMPGANNVSLNRMQIERLGNRTRDILPKPCDKLQRKYERKPNQIRLLSHNGTKGFRIIERCRSRRMYLRGAVGSLLHLWIRDWLIQPMKVTKYRRCKQNIDYVFLRDKSESVYGQVILNSCLYNEFRPVSDWVRTINTQTFVAGIGLRIIYVLHLD